MYLHFLNDKLQISYADINSTHCKNISSKNFRIKFKLLLTSSDSIFAKIGEVATVTDKKLKCPLAMVDKKILYNLHLNCYIVVGELKIVKPNLKSEEMVNFYLIVWSMLKPP